MTSAMEADNVDRSAVQPRFLAAGTAHCLVQDAAASHFADVQIAPDCVRPVTLERPHLSAREREVLRVWLHSDSKREIAELLHLSVGTVNTYLTRVRGKYAALGRPAKTKSALMARALQDKIVSIDDF